jgi:phosphoglycolate phosphatase
MHIIFDYDGTLVDSSQGILHCLGLAMNECGLDPNRALKPSIVGPPLHEMLRKIMPVSDEKLLELVADKFKIVYDSLGFKLAEPFPGIPEMLVELNNLGYLLHIATNKRSQPTNSSLQFLGWNDIFNSVVCVDSSRPAFRSKTDMLRYILDKNELPVSACGYIGDRMDDYYAASANNIPYLMVRWGLESPGKPNNDLESIRYLESPSATSLINKMFSKPSRA